LIEQDIQPNKYVLGWFKICSIFSTKTNVTDLNQQFSWYFEQKIAKAKIIIILTMQSILF
jgi:hypothetical protein